ncbi:MAG: ADP-ribosylglycohydrolase family protein [Cellvibrionaceae bacterium]
MSNEKLTTEDLAFIEVARKAREQALPLEYCFPPASGKMGGPTPGQGEWVYEYLMIRDCERDFSIDQIKGLLDKLDKPSTDLSNRFRGCLLGLALGDALGTTNEFKARGSFQPITDLVGGGPFNLKPGDWTDDTSMAYCLGRSLLKLNDFDAKDQMDAYTMWWKRGAFSVNGRCFDIGNTVRQALEQFEQTGNPFAGSTDPYSAGNGSIMRLAPIPLFYFSSPEKLMHYAGESSRTTHGSDEAISGCYFLAAAIFSILNGTSKKFLLHDIKNNFLTLWPDITLSNKVNEIFNEKFIDKPIENIKSTGYVIDTLEAALWCFFNTNSFSEGALLAANLGDDADTAAAVYGQIAGAFYGEFELPIDWLGKLSYSHIFYLMADDLYKLNSKN